MSDRLKAMMVGLAVLALPLFTEPGLADAARTPKIKALLLIGGFAASVWVGSYIRLSLGAALCGFVSLVVVHGMGSFQSYQLLFFVATVALASLCTNASERSLNIILDCLAFSGVLCSLYAYMQMSGIDPVYFYYKWADGTKPSAFIGQHTLYGSLAATSVTAALFRRRYVMALISAPTVFATDSSFAIASLSVGILAWVWISQGWQTATTLALIFAGILAFIFIGLDKKHYFDSTGRLPAWKTAIEKSKESPIIGYGPGMFKHFYPTVQDKAHKKMHGFYRQAHNDYVQLVYEYGAVGVLCVILMLGDFFRQAWRKKNITSVAALSSILMVFLVNALGSFPFHLVPHGVIALIAWVAVTTHKPRVPEVA